MSDDTKRVLIVTAILLIFTLGYALYVSNQPSKVDTECTKEYVERLGSTDCENKQKADDAEYQQFLESQYQ